MAADSIFVENTKIVSMSYSSWRSSRCQNNDRSTDKELSLFRVRNRSWHCNSDVDVAPAQIVGYFSLDKNRTYISDSSNLSYYRPRAETEGLSLDLNRGIENTRRKLPSADDERLNHLLKWIDTNFTRVQALNDSERWIRPNFVCFRGLLTLLLCTPYSQKEGWIICAARWKGTIYLCAYKTLEEKERNANLSEDHLKFMSWGFKFEKYCLAAGPDKSPETEEPVDENEEFCCMFQRRIGDHTILYGAEMDGILSREKLVDPLPLEKLKFVEVKTSRIIEHDGQERNFRKFKLLKWWAQSFLVGIENILCGFRDDSGVVRYLTTYSLPEIIDKSRYYWEPKACLNFCQAFLTRISETVVNDCDKTIYKFEKIPHGDIVVTEVSPTSEYAFMDSSYLERSK